MQQAERMHQVAVGMGLVKAAGLIQEQDSINRLIHVVNAQYGKEYPTFKGHTVMVEDAEAWITPTKEYSLRPGRYVPYWFERLAKIERKWRWGEFRGFRQRGLPIPDPAEHADIVEAFAAGLAGNMEVVEAFIGLWELAH
jgi:hypothetical protein